MMNDAPADAAVATAPARPVNAIPPTGKELFPGLFLIFVACTAGVVWFVATGLDLDAGTISCRRFVLLILGGNLTSLLVVIPIILSRRRGAIDALGLRGAAFGRFVTWTGIGLAGQAGALAIGLIVARIANIPLHPPGAVIVPMALDRFGFSGVLLVWGVLTPVAVEIFCRGALQGWLRRRLSIGPTVVLQALLSCGFLLSALLNGADQILPSALAAATGAILTWTRERAGSLWPPLAAHVLIGAVTCALFAAGFWPPQPTALLDFCSD